MTTKCGSILSIRVYASIPTTSGLRGARRSHVDVHVDFHSELNRVSSISVHIVTYSVNCYHPKRVDLWVVM